ncbi:MAG: hypothetical protein LRY69_06350 [Gammaproteobacteria bacterium]|nr:hypothetical protein [Gammaproteobacteria bacterium]
MVGKKQTNTEEIPKNFWKRFLFLKKLVKNIEQYDVVQLMSDDSIPFRIVGQFIFLRAIKNKTLIYLVAAGSDYRFATEGRRKLNIPLFDQLEKYGERSFNSFSDFFRNYIVCRHVNGIIGFNEYFEAYRSHKKCLLPVVLPVDLSKVPFFSMDWTSRLIVFHGVQRGREGFKGSDYIKKAFDVLNEKYPDQIECISVGNVPYNEYMNIVAQCHILVDQTNCIGYGMNALIGMAMGKIVCCGSQSKSDYDKWLPLIGVTEYPPIIPVVPDVDFIISKIEGLLLNRRYLVEIGRQSRSYAEK